MLLSKVIVYQPTAEELVVLNSFAYCAAKLWNVGNYEKKNYKALGFEQFPDWYDQKKRLKDHFWFKNLPSQTAQDVLDKLHKSWKSFFTLNETNGIINPRPPKYKEKNSLYNFSFLNNGFKVESSDTIVFTIPKAQKAFLSSKYNFNNKNLKLKIKSFSTIEGKIKTIEFKPLKDSQYQLNVVYEIPDPKLKNDNGHYLSIDIGLSNLFTCYDSAGKSFIVSGAKYLEINHYFHKQIAHYQSISSSQQIAAGLEYPKPTQKTLRLYQKKRRQLHHYFHCVTKEIVNYCVKNDINQVIVGDMKNIRKGANLGKRTNQKLHALPYAKIYGLLAYKLRLQGIELIKIKESFSSQCSPTSADVSKKCAKKSNRKTRGLYKDGSVIYNADSLGAYNILRLYCQKTGKELLLPILGLSSPHKIKVAV